MFKFLTCLFSVFLFFSACTGGQKGAPTSPRVPTPGFENVPQVLILGKPSQILETGLSELTKNAFEMPGRDWLESETGFRVEGVGLSTDGWNDEKKLQELRHWNSRPFDVWIFFDSDLANYFFSKSGLPLQKGRKIFFPKGVLPPKSRTESEVFREFAVSARLVDDLIEALTQQKNFLDVKRPPVKVEQSKIFVGPILDSAAVTPSASNLNLGAAISVGVLWGPWIKSVVASGRSEDNVSLVDLSMESGLIRVKVEDLKQLSLTPDMELDLKNWIQRATLAILRGSK